MLISIRKAARHAAKLLNPLPGIGFGSAAGLLSFTLAGEPMNRSRLVAIAVILILASVSVVLIWADPYYRAHQYSIGLYDYDGVEIEDISGKTGRVVSLSPDEAGRFIFCWASVAHAPMHSAMCHDPAFKITFSGEAGSVIIKDFCFKCKNYTIPTWRGNYLQGIDLRSRPNNDVAMILEAKFPELFQPRVQSNNGNQPYTSWYRSTSDNPVGLKFSIELLAINDPELGEIKNAVVKVENGASGDDVLRFYLRRNVERLDNFRINEDGSMFQVECYARGKDEPEVLGPYQFKDGQFQMWHASYKALIEYGPEP